MEERKIDVIIASSMRDLIKQANSNGILQENIIQIIQDAPNWYLIYQKNA